MSTRPSKPVTLVLAVVVTCLAAASGLAGTYAITRDRIAEQEMLAQEQSLKAAVPAAAAFEEITDQAMLADAAAVAGDVRLGVTDESGNIVSAVFAAKDASGNDIGWGLRLGSRGYGGYVQLVIGLDSLGSVTGVSVLSHAETPGLGSKVMDNKEILGRFTGLPEGFSAKEVKAIDGVAGATKSTRAVKNAVIAAGAIYAEVLSKGGE